MGVNSRVEYKVFHEVVEVGVEGEGGEGREGEGVGVVVDGGDFGGLFGS